jgi:hypothetical protein
MDRIEPPDFPVNGTIDATHYESEKPRPQRRRCAKTPAECDDMAARIRALSKPELAKRKNQLRTCADDNLKLSRSSLVVLGRLVSIADFERHGHAFPRAEAIAERGKQLALRTVRNALSQLQGEGLIVVERRRARGYQAASRYHFPTLASGELPNAATGCKAECKAECTIEVVQSAIEVHSDMRKEVGLLKVVPDPPPLPPSAPRGELHRAFDLYNELAKRLDLPQASKLTEDRARKLKARLNDYGLDGFRQVLREVELSKFLRGGSEWRCDLDYLISPKGFSKTHDGGHRGASRFGKIAAAPQAAPRPGAPARDEVQVFRTGTAEFRRELEAARKNNPARAAQIERDGWVKCRPLEPPVVGAREGARHGPFDSGGIGWKPNPNRRRELAWAGDDRADLALRFPRWGRLARRTPAHHGAPEFQAEVTALYRARGTSEAEAVRAEQRGFLDVWPIPPPSIGELAAGLVAPPAPKAIGSLSRAEKAAIQLSVEHQAERAPAGEFLDFPTRARGPWGLIPLPKKDVMRDAPAELLHLRALANAGGRRSFARSGTR